MKKVDPDRYRPYLLGEYPSDRLGYYQSSLERALRLDLVKSTFEQIRQVAAARDVIIALLPTRADFQRYDPSAASPLGAELEPFAAANGMELVDLLPDVA